MKKAISLPKPFLSGSMLKLLAMLSMLIDHTALYILSGISFFTKPFLIFLGRGVSLYTLFRIVGRLAFPLYAFLLVEGFIHTKNRKKYGLSLLIFALLSELPWNFVHTGKLLYGSQNVMFTLLLGYLALWALDAWKNDFPKQLVSLVCLFVICYFGGTDYGVVGLALILIMYFMREHQVARAITGSCIIRHGWAAGLAFIPIYFYNSERGFIKGKAAKYAAYLFYPLHLLLLGILKHFILK